MAVTAQQLDTTDYLSSKEKNTLHALNEGANFLKETGIANDDFLNISITKLFNNWSNKMLNIAKNMLMKYICAI